MTAAQIQAARERACYHTVLKRLYDEKRCCLTDTWLCSDCQMPIYIPPGFIIPSGERRNRKIAADYYEELANDMGNTDRYVQPGEEEE